MRKKEKGRPWFVIPEREQREGYQRERLAEGEQMVNLGYGKSVMFLGI